MSSTQDRDLAGGRQLEVAGAPIAFFAGEADIMTDSAPALAAITKYQLLALTNTGVTPFIAGTHTGQEAVIALQPQATIGGTVPYMSGGAFNVAAVTWPATINTIALQKALLIGTELHPRHTVY